MSRPVEQLQKGALILVSIGAWYPTIDDEWSLISDQAVLNILTNFHLFIDILFVSQVNEMMILLPTTARNMHIRP